MKYRKEFESFLEAEDKSIRTIESYVHSLINFESWLTKKFSITDLAIVSFREIKQYRDYLNNNYAPTSVNQKLSSIKSFYSFLIKQKIIQDNPSENIKLIKVEDHFENQYLTRSEELKVLSVAKEMGVMPYCIILVFLKTGSRVSEISNLALNDLFLEDNPTILIRNSKGGKSRYIPISTDVVVALNEWLKERNKSDKVYHIRSKYVFVSQRNEKLSIRGIQLLLNRIGEKSNIKLYPIRFRASFANNLLQNTTIPINILANLMGHSNVNTTQRYATPSMVDKRKFVEELSEI